MNSRLVKSRKQLLDKNRNCLKLLFPGFRTRLLFRIAPLLLHALRLTDLPAGNPPGTRNSCH
ncbi:Uncharacterised protein [Achromobacter xylosoxidans]|nr:Uncharacterised protein [Achromobacter xylosoxidans]SQG75730.1 Uncharacterised protein [Achromobacter xylosoxidans]